jgi:predicted TIM-barrel fold metal-dependent hydrolase
MADIVDSHSHVWTLDTAAYPWQPTFGYVPTEPASPDELLGAMDRCGVAHTLLVQPSPYGSDHRFLHEAVGKAPARFSAIGLVDPEDPGSPELAAELVDAGCIGFRVNLSLDLPTAERQAEAGTWPQLGSLGVPICLRTTPRHQAQVKRIVAGLPDTQFVIDHLGLPEPGESRAIGRLVELARYDNCMLKIAGVWRASTLEPPFQDTWPILSAALDLFGASRLMWGSDYPAVRPENGYRDAIAAMRALPFMDEEDLDRVMAGTARRCWQLPDSPPPP